MGKVAQNSAKYVIKASLEAGGMIEKPDVVGAIFGQTEGLLGDELDLRELQERGKVGRIEVDVESDSSGSKGVIEIPSSLDATETALLGASLETLDRIGPSNAEIKVEKIEDQRTSKRDYIVKRAKQLLEQIDDQKPGKTEITEEIKKELRTSETTEYRGFEAGPEVQLSDELILVEGKADLINLMEYGVKNALAIGGTSIPENIQDITQQKQVTAFLDGDRGGDLILKELKQKADPDFIARAPEDKEVEELGKEKVFEALRDKEPVKYTENPSVEDKELSEQQREKALEVLKDLIGSRAAAVLDEDLGEKEKLPVDKKNRIANRECFAVAFDSEIDNEEVETAEEAGAEYVFGMSRSGRASSSKLEIFTRDQLEKKAVEA
ncbi:MAG: DNA primase DnaG [Candidatus Nanohaloarchaea archaeon]